MSGSRQPSASLYTKLKVYRAVLLITLLYSCETWTVYSRHVHANQLNHIHLSCLRRPLHIRWQDKNPDTEVIERAGIPLRWYPPTESPGYMGRPCRQNTWLPTTKAGIVWRTLSRQMVFWGRRKVSKTCIKDGHEVYLRLSKDEQQQIQWPRTIAILRNVLIHVTLFVQTKLY